MIRLTGGQLNGRQIASPKNRDIRPTTGRVRESVFSKIQPRLYDARFVDLFAGTGVMGLEALSRGAGFVMAVEKHPVHARLIRENYEKLGIAPEQHKILNLDVERFVEKSSDKTQLPFDLIYLDPPYGYPEMEKLINQLTKHGWLASDGLILIEQGADDPKLSNFDYKSYGDTVLGFSSF